MEPMTVADLLAALKRAPKTAVVVIGRGPKRKHQCVLQAYTRRVHHCITGKVMYREFMISGREDGE